MKIATLKGLIVAAIRNGFVKMYRVEANVSGKSNGFRELFTFYLQKNRTQCSLQQTL